VPSGHHRVICGVIACIQERSLGILQNDEILIYCLEVGVKSLDRNFNQPGDSSRALLRFFGKKDDNNSGNSGEQKKVWKCQYCNMTFDDKERMKRHTRKAHSEKGDDMPNMNPFGFK